MLPVNYCIDIICLFNKTSKKQLQFCKHLFKAFLQNKLKDLKINERFILGVSAFAQII